MAETEIMLKLVVGYTELDSDKLKKGKGLLKPNFGVLPKCAGRRVRQVRRIFRSNLPLAECMYSSAFFSLEVIRVILETAVTPQSSQNRALISTPNPSLLCQV